MANTPAPQNRGRLASADWLTLWVLRPGVLLLVLGAWQVASLFYPVMLLPGPIETFRQLTWLLLHGHLPLELVKSSYSLLLGMLIAIPTGVLLGLLMGSFPRFEAMIDPYLNALYVTPTVMLIPLFIIWFGIDLKAQVAYITVTAYFPIVVTTMAGVRSLRGHFTETARAFGASSLDMFLKIYLPGAVPMMMSGIRLALGRAVVGMITAEMFLATVGLGYMVVDFGNRLATDKVLAMAVVLAAFGICLTAFVKWLERRLAPWAKHDQAA